MVKQQEIVKVSRIVALMAVAAVLLAAALGVDSAVAGKGANGSNHNNGGTTTATLTITPNPVAAGSEYVVSGTDFAAAAGLSLRETLVLLVQLPSFVYGEVMGQPNWLAAFRVVWRPRKSPVPTPTSGLTAFHAAMS